MAGFAQGLLSSIQPWITGASPSALDNSTAQYGGFQGLLDAMLQAGNPNSSAAQFGKALEGNQDAALQRAAARQNLAQGAVSLQRSAMMLPVLQAYYGAATGSPSGNGAASGFGMTPASGAPLSGSSAGGNQGITTPSLLPSGGSSGTSTAGVASPFSAPTPNQIASMSVGGMSPQMLRLGAMLSGQNPLAATQQLRQQQLALAQQQYGPVLAQLDTLNKAQSPTQYVKSDPSLLAQWRQMAPTLGYDPVRDLTDPNVRTAFSFLRNRIAGALSQPTVAPPVQMSTFGGPLGSLFSRNPVTGAITQVKPEESLKSVVDPRTGNVTYLPASQATGRAPFSSETYVNPSTTAGLARLIANYEVPPLSGFALRSAQGQAIMAAVKQLNPGYDSTQFTTKQRARQAFATGKQGDIVRSLSVATNHLDQLSQAADALAQHDFPTFNRLSNAIGSHITGANPQTNFDAMKEIVGDEVVKAVVGTSGAEGDREAIKNAFDAARSPAQIQGVIQKYEGLMGGQLGGLRRQYKKSTGLNDFDSFVSQQAQQTLNPPRGSVSDAALLKKWSGQ